MINGELEIHESDHFTLKLSRYDAEELSQSTVQIWKHWKTAKLDEGICVDNYFYRDLQEIFNTCIILYEQKPNDMNLLRKEFISATKYKYRPAVNLSRVWMKICLYFEHDFDVITEADINWSENRKVKYVFNDILPSFVKLV